MGQPRDDDDDDGDRGLNDSKWLEKWLLNRRFALTWKSKGVLLRDAGRTGFQRVVDKAHTNVHGWREWVTKNRTLTKWMSCDDDEWMSGYRPSCALCLFVLQKLSRLCATTALQLQHTQVFPSFARRRWFARLLRPTGGTVLCLLWQVRLYGKFTRRC